jgi:hypothetical protein
MKICRLKFVKNEWVLSLRTNAPAGNSSRTVKHLHLVLRLRICEDIPPIQWYCSLFPYIPLQSS